MARVAAASADVGSAPSEFESPPPHLKLIHSLEINVPLASSSSAQILYQVMSVDKPLRPKETHIAFRVRPSEQDKNAEASTMLDVLLQTSSVRQLRLSSNAILDDISLILETMEAFPSSSSGVKIHEGTAQDEEFELSGTGRAG
ncbi:hypothetical protein CBS101457_004018 [Exobasidium rhododendri]|nr:hypothetical protein CBS101457_004018 [Exobasidium rhododendri]